jgi:hypothetical protein
MGNETTTELVNMINDLNSEVSRLQDELGRQTYKGNSISYIYDKMKCYRDQVLMGFNALRKIGLDTTTSNGNEELKVDCEVFAEKIIRKLVKLEVLEEAIDTHKQNVTSNLVREVGERPYINTIDRALWMKLT